MAETRQIVLGVGVITRVYVASKTTLVMMRTNPGGVGSIFGFSGSIPPNGSDDWFPVGILGATWFHRFVMEPGEELWISQPGAAIGNPNVSLVFSPVE